jgi:predicted ATPase
MRTIEELTVRNFKSIRDQTLRLGRLNAFIGGNGSGKSNLVGVFHFLNQIVRQQLQTYAGMAGGADNLLFFGRKRSPTLEIAVNFVSGTNANGYRFELIPTEEDRFVFADETISYHDRSQYPRPYRIGLVSAGHPESKLPDSKERVAGYVRSDLGSYRIYHFHDTSSGAKVKQTGDLDDNRTLREDASNRVEGESVFRHLGKEDLSAWLDGYALGDLWERNVVGA